jgi:hypothetical protein
LSYIAFQVSSATNSNFTAQLLAFNSLGQQIGTFQVIDTGAGGGCAGLSNVAGPLPCDDAPLIQFYDATTSITKVELIITDDLSGFYIDTFEADVVPEPGTVGMMLFGLAVGYCARKSSSARPTGLPKLWQPVRSTTKASTPAR